MQRHNRYEIAFADYLRTRQIPYIAVDEKKRSAFREARLKSFDFIVYSQRVANWLVDIKGRRFISRRSLRVPAWENWVTRDDLDALRQWERVFGADFAGLIVFAYEIRPEDAPPAEIVHAHGAARYAFVAAPLQAYDECARVRSPKWGTVHLSVADFERVARPVSQVV